MPTPDSIPASNPRRPPAEGSLHDIGIPDVRAVVPQTAPALIRHVLSFNETYRREFPELLRLARRVEAVHRGHPDVPRGLSLALGDLQFELETHLAREEVILFPMMRGGTDPSMVHTIARMRDEHAQHLVRLQAIEELSNHGIAPAGACPSWLALCAGVRKLVDGLREHIRLEDDVLFPKFEPSPVERLS